MDHDDVEEHLRTVLAEVLELDPSTIKGESDFAELDADSIDLIECVNQIERKYGIAIEEERFYDIERFDQLVSLIKEEIARQA